MAKKTATIRLSFLRSGFNKNAPQYQVEQVTDSTAFSPGDILERAKVDELCVDQRWKVTVQRVAK